MARNNPRPGHRNAHPDPPVDPWSPTNERVPPRRPGGQELPDDVQDRPEQNAGYDAAVSGGDAAAEAAGEVRRRERTAR